MRVLNNGRGVGSQKQRDGSVRGKHSFADIEDERRGPQTLVIWLTFRSWKGQGNGC